MRPEEFILKIVKAYRQARVPVETNKKISRGRSRSTSSIAEDLFAYYLIKNDSSIQNIFVDQAIYLTGANKSIYPDITLVKDGVISAFLDLKMDMGWKRKDLLNLCKKHGQTIGQARASQARLKDGQTKQVQTLPVSKNVSYSIVIISRRNSGGLLDSLREEAKKLKVPIDTFLLCDSGRYHPNEYQLSPKDLVEKLDVNTSEFDRLLKKLK